MEGPPLGPGGKDITWPDQVAPRGRKASSTRKIKPQTSNLQPVHLHPASNRQLTTPTAGHRRNADYGCSGTIGGRHATEPPTRTCIQTGGATTPATTARSHSDPGAPGIPCREESLAQPDEYGGSRHPTRATPWHRTSANEPSPGPHRRPSSTTPNTTRRVQTGPQAVSPPGSGNTGPPRAPPTPRHTNPADGGPHTRASRRHPHTDAYRYPDQHNQSPAPRHRTPPRPQRQREPQFPGSGNIERIGPRGHLPALAQAEPASPRHHDPPAGRAVQPTETPSRSRPAPDLGPDPDPDLTRATIPADTPRSADTGGQTGPTPVPEGHT